MCIRGHSIKTRIETPASLRHPTIACMALEDIPLKQGLKLCCSLNEVNPYRRIRGHSIKTRIETRAITTSPSPLCLALEDIPLKQGLKLSIAGTKNTSGDALEDIPLKQGLKHKFLEQLAEKKYDALEDIPLKQGLKH